MITLDLLKEIASLGGYNITGTDAQAVANKARALRRLNQVRSDIQSRYSGRWQGAYREGWLPIVPVYGTGTVAVTQGSRTVTGTNTVWVSTMVGRKFLGPNNEYYKIAAVGGNTTLTLTEPYQGADVTSGGSYQIWKDEYPLYPEVFSVIDFVNYTDPLQMTEDFPKHGRLLSPRSTAAETPKSYMIVGRQQSNGSYSTGTVSITSGSKTLTGVATSWLGNIYPGYSLTIGAYTYNVYSVDSDTQITLYQYAVATAAGLTYSAKGSNALVVRFLYPSGQSVVNYSYYSKSYPLMSDSDEDWLAELYPHLILDGIMKYDFLDKNDPVRASQAAQLFENSVKNAQVSDQSSFAGTAVLGLDIPDHARE